MHAISLVGRRRRQMCVLSMCECACVCVCVCVFWLFSLHTACQVAIVDGWAKNEDWVFVIVVDVRGHISFCCLQSAAWREMLKRYYKRYVLLAVFLPFVSFHFMLTFCVCFCFSGLFVWAKSGELIKHVIAHRAEWIILRIVNLKRERVGQRGKGGGGWGRAKSCFAFTYFCRYFIWNKCVLYPQLTLN